MGELEWLDAMIVLRSLLSGAARLNAPTLIILRSRSKEALPRLAQPPTTDFNPQTL
jgi:hypothetical protein